MDKIKFYQSGDEWRWRRRSSGNNEIIGASSEGFDSLHNALENARLNYGDSVEYVSPHDELDDGAP